MNMSQNMELISQGLLSVGTTFNSNNNQSQSQNQKQAHLRKNRNKWNQIVITEYDTKDLLARYQHTGESIDVYPDYPNKPFLVDASMKHKK